MNVSCPDCRTTYRIDPARVSPRGVRARCMRCPGIFEVEPPADAAVVATAPAPLQHSTPPRDEAVEAPDITGEPVRSGSESWGNVDDGDAPAGSGSAPAEARAGAPSSESLGRSEREMVKAAGEGASGLGPAPFGSRDPDSRARRLARALVSDIVVYHPDRRDRSLRSGTLRQEFREEIRKSWDEYASRVGGQMARDTRYFQDALNEILAGGNRLF